jgi:heme-degrading monooxygenase HmoA
MVHSELTPPYYAVIFTSIRTDNLNDYSETAERMLTLAQKIPGFLGVESARDSLGITISYWENKDAIRAWREHPEHKAAIKRGIKEWYDSFTTRICKVEKEHRFNARSENDNI